MIGSSAGIAAAANYPAPFVSGGSSDVAVVYGANAAVSDSVQAFNVNLDLQSRAGTGGSTVTTTCAGGDCYLFEQASTTQEKIDLSTIPDKKLDTYIFENPYHSEPFKIQDRKTVAFPRERTRDESILVHRDRKIIYLYGVPVKVASKDHLIATKTGIRTRKNRLGALKDMHDVEHLRSLKKLEGKSIEERLIPDDD